MYLQLVDLTVRECGVPNYVYIQKWSAECVYGHHPPEANLHIH